MSFIKIITYTTSRGKSPFWDWESTLDTKVQAIVANRIDRLRLGNMGDCKPIKGAAGIKELRINFGPGYRIYIGMHGTTIVVLLAGGDKGSQERDIEKAKQYWLECKEELL